MEATSTKQPRTTRTNHLSVGNTSLIHIFLDNFHTQLGRTLVLLCVATSILLLPACSCEDSEAKFKRKMDSAKQYVEEEKYNEARIQLQSAIDIKPKNADAYFQLAEVLIRLGKVPSAVENYNTAINYDPEHRKARLHLASILLAGRQYEFAENHINKLLDADHQDIEALVLRANLEASGPRKDYKKARRILKEVLVRKPESVAALASLAHVELASENSDKAEELFTRALSVEPNNAPLQMALADLYSREGRLDEAQQAIEKLVDENPEQSSLRHVFGEFLLRRGLGEKAIEQYSETLKTDPSRHAARDRLYDMFLTRGKKEEAKSLTADLVKALPEDAGVHYFKGRDAEVDGKNEVALKEFIECIKGMNNFAPAFRRAGLLELRYGKGREGIEHLNQAIAIDPGDVPSRLALARILFSRRDFSQATEHLDQVLRRYPRQLGANVIRADIALIEGETTKARTVYEFLIKAFPNDPVGYFKLALLEEQEGKLEEAAKLYLKTLEFDRGILPPARRLSVVRLKQKKDLDSIITEIQALQDKSKKSKPEFNMLLGSITLAKKDDPQRFEKARKLFSDALEGNPNLIGAYFTIAAIDSRSGDLDSAVANYEKLLEKKPTHTATQMMLALTKEKQKEYKDAAELYEKILASNSRFGPAANNLAWLLVEELNGDLDKALKLAEIAKEELPKESSVADTLGWVYFRRGSARAALPLLQEALQLQKIADEQRPANPEILYHLAEVQFALGNKKEAKKTISEALKLLGNNKHPKRAQMEKLRKQL